MHWRWKKGSRPQEAPKGSFSNKFALCWTFGLESAAEYMTLRPKYDDTSGNETQSVLDSHESPMDLDEWHCWSYLEVFLLQIKIEKWDVRQTTLRNPFKKVNLYLSSFDRRPNVDGRICIPCNPDRFDNPSIATVSVARWIHCSVERIAVWIWRGRKQLRTPGCDFSLGRQSRRTNSD